MLQGAHVARVIISIRYLCVCCLCVYCSALSCLLYASLCGRVCGYVYVCLWWVFPLPCFVYLRSIVCMCVCVHSVCVHIGDLYPWRRLFCASLFPWDFWVQLRSWCCSILLANVEQKLSEICVFSLARLFKSLAVCEKQTGPSDTKLDPSTGNDRRGGCHVWYWQSFIILARVFLLDIKKQRKYEEDWKVVWDWNNPIDGASVSVETSLRGPVIKNESVRISLGRVYK